MDESMTFKISLDVRFEQVDANGNSMYYNSGNGTNLSQTTRIKADSFLEVCGILGEFDALMRRLKERTNGE